MAAAITEIPNTSQQLVVDESADLLFQRRCCFFWFSSFPSDRSVRRVSCFDGGCWERVKTTAEESENSGKWWVRGWKRVREWSELIAGPRWKTFIRRFNQNGRHRGRYQYDPMSYALNFDQGGPVHEAEYAYGDFSARFAAVPMAKSRDFSKDALLFSPVNEERTVS